MEEKIQDWIRKKLEYEREVGDEEIQRWKALSDDEKDKMLTEACLLAESQLRELKKNNVKFEQEELSEESKRIWNKLRERYAQGERFKI